MDAVWSLRLFEADAPSEYVTGGVISETDNGSWNHRRGGVDRYADEFDAFVSDEVEDGGEPAPQRVYDGVAVVLEGVKFEVVEDDMTHVFRTDLMDDRWQTICDGSHDDETGITAQSLHDDEKVANAVQRASDALDRRVCWLKVISPRSFDGVVDAAEDLVGDNGDE
jgi:hypothetical protein